MASLNVRLFRAIERSSVDVVKSLVQQGASVNHVSGPLHGKEAGVPAVLAPVVRWASYRSEPAGSPLPRDGLLTLEVLIDAGANVDARLSQASLDAMMGQLWSYRVPYNVVRLAVALACLSATPEKHQLDPLLATVLAKLAARGADLADCGHGVPRVVHCCASVRHHLLGGSMLRWLTCGTPEDDDNSDDTVTAASFDKNEDHGRAVSCGGTFEFERSVEVLVGHGADPYAVECDTQFASVGPLGQLGAHDAFLRHLAVGQRVDAQDCRHVWLKATVVMMGRRSGTFLVHYDGWACTYDEWCSADAIAPLGTTCTAGTWSDDPTNPWGKHEVRHIKWKPRSIMAGSGIAPAVWAAGTQRFKCRVDTVFRTLQDLGGLPLPLVRLIAALELGDHSVLAQAWPLCGTEAI